MSIQLHDTLTRTRKTLSPFKEGDPFRMYCCGPTVYGPAHIGNFRTFIIQDVLRRTLELAYGIDRVQHARNLTDVDDKTILRSQQAGISLSDFTKKWTKKFHADCAALNLRPPTFEPSATGTIPQQSALIEKILENGHAYQGPDGSVYFRLSSYPEYGALSHFDRDQLRTQATNSAGQANDADEYVRDNVADFALWKARKEEDGPNWWAGPRVNGKAVEGRPGWHIECSAMIDDVFGGQTIDLHGGGEDLCFPHHENEIAQSMCAHDHDAAYRFVRHWFHSTHLLVDGKKMSKSLGNLYTLEDLQKKGFSPMAVRYALIAGHYRKQLNFTLEGVAAAQKALEKIRRGVEEGLKTAGISAEAYRKYLEHLPKAIGPADGICDDNPVWHALCDDLNTPEALGAVFTILSDLKNRTPEETRLALRRIATACYALGLDIFAEEPASKLEIPADIAELAQKRWEAKQARNWTEADRLRDALAAAGWKSLDRKDGYSLEKI